MSQAPPKVATDLKTTLQKVPLLHTVNNSSVVATIIQTILQRFSGVDLEKQHKNDPNLISYICNLVENAFTEASRSKVDKKTIAMQVMAGLIPNLTAEDNETISGMIEFIHSTGQISKLEEEIEEIVIPFFKRCLRFFLKGTSS